MEFGDTVLINVVTFKVIIVHFDSLRAPENMNTIQL